MMNLKTEYNSWANTALIVRNSTKQQYVKNIENLSEIIGYNIFETDDIPKIEALYTDLLKNQKTVGGKYYSHERPSASLKGWYSAAVNKYLEFLEDRSSQSSVKTKNLTKFNIKEFGKAIHSTGLNFDSGLITRFTSSLLTKPFVILTGLTGSGKTKIAQSFAEWICQSESQYKIVPVGADWTNREPLLGYPNGLDDDKYVLPDNGVLELMIRAKDNETQPFFLILDEMNLSHVERYFADFLSIMESGKEISLYSGKARKSGELEIPFEIRWPLNLFIIGTVNIDETTYMFSPKVLDRANVIEFRLKKEDLETYFDQTVIIPLLVNGDGAKMAESFLELSKNKKIGKNEDIQKELLKFFEQLALVGAEFGYRSVKEIMILTEKLKQIDPKIKSDDQIDIAIMQKLLPKLHGSRSKLSKILLKLVELCAPGVDTNKILEEGYDPKIIYPLSYEKLKRMYKNAIDNGFASYAEA